LFHVVVYRNASFKEIRNAGPDPTGNRKKPQFLGVELGLDGASESS